MQRCRAIFFIFISLCAGELFSQSLEALKQTWSHTSELGNALRAAANGAQTKANPAAYRFTPGPDPGVADELATAFSKAEDQKSNLKDLFTKVKQAYETDQDKDKVNNLAAAFTFFISADVVAYTQTDEPDDNSTNQLFEKLQIAISNDPEFAQMTDREKQRVHDWLVCVGGFTMLGYADAKQTGDAQNLAAYREFAANSLRLVMGMDPGEISLGGGKFVLKKE